VLRTIPVPFTHRNLELWCNSWAFVIVKNVIQFMVTLILIITQCYKYLLEVSEQTI